jgi:cell division protein FtsB
MTLNSIKEIWNAKLTKELTDVRNIGLYVFAIIVLAISWSAAKTVQNNYELQKQISNLKQQNAVAKLQNENISLNNKYLQTDQYTELSARQNLGLAAPGEKVLVVPKNIAMKYVDKSLLITTNNTNPGEIKDNRSSYQKNLEDWRDFLLGRKLFDN